MVKDIIVINLNDLLNYCGYHRYEYNDIQLPHVNVSIQSDRCDVISPM